jgi:hypothetical protein
MDRDLLPGRLDCGMVICDVMRLTCDSKTPGDGNMLSTSITAIGIPSLDLKVSLSLSLSLCLCLCLSLYLSPSC